MVTILEGHALAMLATLPNNSVDLPDYVAIIRKRIADVQPPLCMEATT